MTNSTPKVSVLMPIYNTKPEVLRKTIEAVLNQTFKDFEFVILNDSPDNKNLKTVIDEYKDSRIKYFENERNIGISKSRNKLVELSQGEYLAVVDHDDISRDYRLEKQVEYLDKNKSVGVVSGGMYFINKKKIKMHPQENLDIKYSLAKGCYISHPAAMIRKSVLEHYHIRYEEQYFPSEDYMLWVRLMDKTLFHNLNCVLIDYNDSESNTTTNYNNEMMDKDLLIKNIVFKDFPLFAEAKDSKRWIMLFGFIPFIKIKVNRLETLYYLFGLILILKTVSYKQH